MIRKIKKHIPKKIILQYHRILAYAASVIYQNPSKNITVIGVTGTDGKTSTTIIISQLLDLLGYKTAYTTTAEFKLGDKKWTNATKQTMQGRFALQKFIKQAVKENCSHIVIETSSQGIEQFRHIGIQYDIAVFTNLSPDHIEAHGSLENYRKEKEKLFNIVGNAKYKQEIPKKLIINEDDEAAEFFKKYNAEIVDTYAVKKSAKFKASGVQVKNSTQYFDMEYQDAVYQAKTQLLGTFNIYNILSAIGVAATFEPDIKKIIELVSKIKPIPGRLESIQEGQDFMVLVDYAHAENALENVLKTAKTISQNNVISVLGSCGGGRDVEKRPRLGKIAATYADIVIVTNEDPYDEDPMDIITAVADGAKKEGKKEGSSLLLIEERKKAIKKAIALGQTGDVIIITGKGSEQSMVVKNEKKIPWDDREITRSILRNKGSNQ